MSNIERSPGDSDASKPEPDISEAERRRLIQWRLDWLWEEINEAWGEQDEYLVQLQDEWSYWKDELEDPEGKDIPDLDEEGRPIGMENSPYDFEDDF